MDPHTFSGNTTGVWFRGSNTFSDSVWIHRVYIYTGWWFQPLWTILYSQLGSLFPIYGKEKAMFQTTNQIELNDINLILATLRWDFMTWDPRLRCQQHVEAAQAWTAKASCCHDGRCHKSPSGKKKRNMRYITSDFWLITEISTNEGIMIYYDVRCLKSM